MQLILDNAKFELIPINPTGSNVAEGGMISIADLDGSGIVVQAPLELDALDTVATAMAKFVAECRAAAGKVEVVRELPAGLRDGRQL